MTINEYIRPESVEEAYELLCADDGNAILGGMTAIKTGKAEIEKGIDISSLGMSYVHEQGSELAIGAYTSLREIELSDAKGLDLIKEAVYDIEGVQFRRHVTIGGAVMLNRGHADVLAPLLALNAKLVFHNAGTVSYEEALKNGLPQRDILKEVRFDRDYDRAGFAKIKRSANDLAYITAAVVKRGGEWRIAIGNRPGTPTLCSKACETLIAGDIDAACAAAVEETEFGTDMRATKEYRRELCHVVIKRAWEEAK